MGFYNLLVFGGFQIGGNIILMRWIYSCLFCLLFEGGNVESYSPLICIEMHKYFCLLKGN